MNNPFFNSIQLRIFYMGIWVIIAITQIILFHHFTFYNLSLIVNDSLITNTLQATCVLLLWYPVRYYLKVFSLSLFLFFHFLLLLLFLAVWLGLGFLITKVVVEQPFEYVNFYLNVLPLRIVIGILIYIVFALVYYLFIARLEIKVQQNKVDESDIKTETKPVEKLNRISVKKRNHIHFIPVDQIDYIEANGDYVFIHTERERYIKDKTMKYWETNLPDDTFIRIHRSFIANIEYIHRMELYEKESYRIHLKNEVILRASNAGYRLLKSKINS